MEENNGRICCKCGAEIPEGEPGKKTDLNFAVVSRGEMYCLFCWCGVDKPGPNDPPSLKLTCKVGRMYWPGFFSF